MDEEELYDHSLLADDELDDEEDEGESEFEAPETDY
jgi:hypothetical protein